MFALAQINGVELEYLAGNYIINMDREQKIRFIKEIIAASDKLKNSDEEGFQKLSDNIEKGMFSKFNIEGAGDFSSEDLDEVLKESPWVVDMVFEMIKGFNSEALLKYPESFQKNICFREVFFHFINAVVFVIQDCTY